MPQHIIDPVLNIYVGTSPTAVAYHVNRELARLPERDRRRVATLMIDTMRLQAESWNGSRPYGADLMHIQTPRYERYAAWTPQQRHNMYVTNHNGAHKPGMGTYGAGGVRNNGHIAFCSSAHIIQQRLIDKFNQISAPPPDRQDERAVNALRVNIVTFLGGGTGSGVLPALAVLVRYLASRRVAQPQTAIYAVLPEQPRGLTEEMRQRQRSNAFSVLSELISLLRLKDQQTAPPYVIGPLSLDVSALQIADIVYLYGYGLTEHADIYQHIAMDLLLRIQDGHGAGFERKRMLPDISALKDLDSRKLPTCFGTSGVTEIVFPREALIGAWSRSAARAVIATQTGDLADPNDEDRFADRLHQQVLELLDNRLADSSTRHRSEDFDSGIIDFGESWWEQLEQQGETYRKNLGFERSALAQQLEEECKSQIEQYVARHREATFARNARIYATFSQQMRRTLNSHRLPEPVERDHTYEQELLNPGFWRRLRRNDGDFVDYANERLTSHIEVIGAENRRAVLALLCDRLEQESQLRDQILEHLRPTGDDISRDDRILLEEGRLPTGHHYYTRLALPSREQIERCYLRILQQRQLSNGQQLDINRVLDALQRVQEQRAREQRAAVQTGTRAYSNHAGSASNISQNELEQFFADVFHQGLTTRDTHGQERPKTVVEIILEIGGAPLLRQHLAWGVEWARSHLEYNRYQEPTTNGRIARQLDIAVMSGSDLDLMTRVLNEEMTRSEVQDGFKLLQSEDPDRISLLYTEYGIPVRAIDRMHEDNDSYLAEYLTSQAQWSDGGTMPPHTSDYLEQQVAAKIDGDEPLVLRMADEPQKIDLAKLYPPRSYQVGRP